MAHLRKRFFGTSISRSLILGMVMVVVVTVIAGGLPAVFAISLQLEQQVWLRVEAAQGVTKALYQAETDRLAMLSQLIAQRPTLQSLLQASETQALIDYIDELQQGTEVDMLAVVLPDRQILGHIGDELPAIEGFPLDVDVAQTDFLVLDDPPRLMIVAAYRMLTDPPGPETGTWVLVGRLMDDVFMQELSRQTGLAQSLIIGEMRVATSLATWPDWSLEPDAMQQVVSSGASCCVRGEAETESYYLGLAPLTDRQGNVVALSEVALPGTAIDILGRRTMVALSAVGLAVALAGSILATVLTRRITRPLQDLARTADLVRAGDLEARFQSDSNLTEIRLLTDQLEAARLQLRYARQITEESKERTEQLLGAIHDGVVVLDQHGCVSFFNLNAERILGRPASDVMAKHHRQVFPPVPGETITLDDVISPPEGGLPGNRLTILDGKDRPIAIEVSTSRLNYDLPYGMRELALVFRDVSEQEAVERLRSEFLANVSHEFRTPLSSFIATTELLNRDGPTLTIEEMIELGNAFRISALQLQTLIDNLLESATIDAGHFRIRKSAIKLEEVVSSVATVMNPLLRRRQQNLELQIPPDIPRISADPDRLGQVLVNLIANASKFGPMGMPITLSAGRQREQIRIAVLDSGPGLPAERFSDLFERFVKGDGTPGAKYGLGLGLSVVKAIVEAHGGEVGAENRTEGGAIVWFTLPIEGS